MIGNIVKWVFFIAALITATAAFVTILRYGLKDNGKNTEETGKILKRALLIMTVNWGIIIICGMLIILK